MHWYHFHMWHHLLLHGSKMAAVKWYQSLHEVLKVNMVTNNTTTWTSWCRLHHFVISLPQLHDHIKLCDILNLTVYLSVCLYIYVSVCLPASVSLSLCLPVCLYLYHLTVAVFLPPSLTPTFVFVLILILCLSVFLSPSLHNSPTPSILIWYQIQVNGGNNDFTSLYDLMM